MNSAFAASVRKQKQKEEGRAKARERSSRGSNIYCAGPYLTSALCKRSLGAWRRLRRQLFRHLSLLLSSVLLPWLLLLHIAGLHAFVHSKLHGKWLQKLQSVWECWNPWHTVQPCPCCVARLLSSGHWGWGTRRWHCMRKNIMLRAVSYFVSWGAGLGVGWLGDHRLLCPSALLKTTSRHTVWQLLSHRQSAGWRAYKLLPRGFWLAWYRSE